MAVKMTFTKSNSAPIVLALASALALVLAFIAEYGFDLAPCELCLKQRIPFYVVIGWVIPVLIWRNDKIRRIALAMMAAALLINSGIATYHTGVEQKWWPGPGACSGPPARYDTIDDLRNQILSTPVVRCDEPAVEYLGFITMASANIAFSLLLAVYAMLAIIRMRRVNP